MSEPVELSSYERKERKISALPEVQRLCLTLEEKNYPDYIIQACEELVKKVALCDAKKVDDLYEESDGAEEEIEIEVEDYRDVPLAKMTEKLKKRKL